MDDAAMEASIRKSEASLAELKPGSRLVCLATGGKIGAAMHAFVCMYFTTVVYYNECVVRMSIVTRIFPCMKRQGEVKYRMRQTG